MPYTPKSAYEEFLDVAGSEFQYVVGPNQSQLARIVKYEMSPDKNTLYFVMSDGNKIDSKQFDQIMVKTSTGESQGADPRFSAKTEATLQQKKDFNDLDVLAQELAASGLELVDENEEREAAKRLAEHKVEQPQPQANNQLPPQPQQQAPVQAPSPLVKEQVPEEHQPIYILLDKRKTKPKATISVEVELDFIDKNTYALIDTTLDDALNGVSGYFSGKVDFEKLKESFVESLKSYLVNEFGATEEEKQVEVVDTIPEQVEPEKQPEKQVEEEPKEEPKVGGGPIRTKKHDVLVEVSPTEKK